MLTTRAADVIRLARGDVDMTQAQLAAAAGVQQPTVSAYESGAKKPRPETLDRILRAARARPSIPLVVYAAEIRSAAAVFGLKNVRVFGSVVRGQDTETSDIDLLVDTGIATSLLDIGGFASSVEEITGFSADVLTDRQVPDPFLTRVRAEAVTL